MSKQLNIEYIFERLIFLENAIDTILEDHQLKGIYLQRRSNMDEAKRKRRNFKITKKILRIT